jgi:hypothetical protein
MATKSKKVAPKAIAVIIAPIKKMGKTESKMKEKMEHKMKGGKSCR